jgi:ABC-type molybdate transport system substrate-binding protein
MAHKRPIMVLTLALAAAWGASAHAGDLVVSAAASLTNAFKEVAQGYEKQHAGTKVILNFGASDVLLQQIVKGAPADVFASADQKAMQVASAKGAGGYRKWAKGALIAMVFLNFNNIFAGRFIPVLIGMVFLWLPAMLADMLTGEDE